MPIYTHPTKHMDHSHARPNTHTHTHTHASVHKLTKPTTFSFLADRLMDNKHHLSHVLSMVKVLVESMGVAL